MNPEPAVRACHAAIISVATEKLGRKLTDQEQTFITSRGGFIALEMISDTVNGAATKDELAKYLNSEV